MFIYLYTIFVMFDLIEILPQNISLTYLLDSFDNYFIDNNIIHYNFNDISNTNILIEKICYDYTKYILEKNGYMSDNMLLTITNNTIMTNEHDKDNKCIHRCLILFDENKEDIIIDKMQNNYLLINSKKIVAVSYNNKNIDYKINGRYLIISYFTQSKKINKSLQIVHDSFIDTVSNVDKTKYNEIPIDFNINCNKVYINNINIYNLNNDVIVHDKCIDNILHYINKLNKLNKMDENKYYCLYLNKKQKIYFNHSEDDIKLKYDYKFIGDGEINTEHNFYNKTYIDNEYIYTIDNFLSETECNELIHIRNNSVLNNYNFQKYNLDYNKSKNIFLNHDYNKVTLNICNKISKLVGYPLNNSKCMHISWFEENDFDLPHYNTIFENKYDTKQDFGGEIFKTIIIYLNKPIEGGDTRFKLLNQNIVPEMGKLLHINDTYNIDNTSTGYDRYIFALNENEKIIKGEKLILKIHFRHSDIIKSHSYDRNNHKITNNCEFIEMKKIYKIENVFNDNLINYIKTYYDSLNVNKLNCVNNKLTPLFINIFEQVILHNIMKIYNLNDEKKINVSECYITNDKNNINNISKDAIVALILLNNIDIHLLINNRYLKNVYNQVLLFDKTNSCIEIECNTINFLVYTFAI
jgi:prolyl 4-hydroxylase